ncbi:UDP-N-acetylglucosamine 1-carboxyvinyltransferase [Clostridium niameyense]|uniref:UDP-N-acetylglucosamine 1-carboxyvinyltransferase n=1 Tax=Clostridium niameyense TaxID=1622073 RepID=A0A6M0RDQ0_9CLOT|nr:UDP-N-acetylglucosamine 1-carboxyvinyltransferase [Clostridium niameyense]NEZ47438.1 UDP-N-acetylglucosamine 1-carboxyvinyltransferase [Clostridium niameyense]
MDKIVVKGGSKLKGEVNISSAKNSVLPIIAGSILSANKCVINGVSMLEDVYVISDILKSICADVDIDETNEKIVIDTKNIINKEADSELVKKMRASFLLMGPMLSRFGKFRISMPGGCNIGTRPIDLHLKGFTALGARVSIGHGYVECLANKLIGNKIYLDFPSVGATENIIMAAVMAEGETIIENAAQEPEVEDLVNFLNSIGADIKGAGTGNVTIRGVKNLNDSVYVPIYDRIEAGTFMIAAAITKSRIKLNGIIEQHLKPIIAKLREMGVTIDIKGHSAVVDGSQGLKTVDIKTMPYPGFPTDMQAQMMALLSTIKGTSIITETIFENRFMHVSEMKRMGANIKINGRSAVIEGVDKLTGTDVKATDLRAGAALILCSLAAEGYTEIGDIYHIDRGYFKIEDKLKKLGAQIERVNR